MYRYKTAVYSICKNEGRHISRWMDSMKEADGIFVLDTGSDDNSAELLSSLGAHVSHEDVAPWRFDKARNLSLAAVPDDYDICVCCDLDEVFLPGWRSQLDKAWSQGCRRVSYPFVYATQPDGSESFFYRDLIHSRHGFEWIYPIHEALVCRQGEEKRVICDEIRLYHYPDPQKPRDGYLPLLEAAVGEYPGDMRMLHYLGREYMYRGMYEKALQHLYIHAKACRWDAERSASLRYMGRCLDALGRPQQAEKAYLLAVRACPHMREPYVELALHYHSREAYGGCLDMALGAISICQPSLDYFNESFAWGSLPWDLASVSAFRLGYVERALYYVQKALDLAPEDQRLIANRDIMLKNIPADLSEEL